MHFFLSFDFSFVEIYYPQLSCELKIMRSVVLKTKNFLNTKEHVYRDY